MRIFKLASIAPVILITALATTVGCGDDDKPSDSSNGPDGGGKAGSGGGKAGSGADKAGSGASEGDGGSAGSGSGSSGSGGHSGSGGGSSGSGADDGGTPDSGTDAGTSACDLSGTGLSHEAIPNPTGTITLTSDKVWDLSDTTYVEDGDVLTIEPCTRIEGQKSPLGTLVVSRGGKIMADGTATAPILFTSAAAVGSRMEGDWGGVILLGKASNFQGDMVNIEGLAADPANQHGGTTDDDDSGVMRYVGILYPGYELSPGNEINGFTFGSVGSGTTIENIFVGQPADDCYEWFGGSVNVKNIVCQNSDDDMFDTDYGWSGTITNAFGRQTYAPTESSNGIETGYDQAVSITPTGNLTGTYKNVTTCGLGVAVTKTGYGLLSRAYVETHVDEFVATGYDYGFNQEFPQDGAGITISHSTLSGMFADATNQIANPADDDTKDNTFDEVAWFTGGTGNTTDALSFTAADCDQAGVPAAAVMSSGVGAFKDSATWMDWVPADWWDDK